MSFTVHHAWDDGNPRNDNLDVKTKDFETEELAREFFNQEVTGFVSKPRCDLAYIFLTPTGQDTNVLAIWHNPLAW